MESCQVQKKVARFPGNFSKSCQVQEKVARFHGNFAKSCQVQKKVARFPGNFVWSWQLFAPKVARSGKVARRPCNFSALGSGAQIVTRFPSKFSRPDNLLDYKLPCPEKALPCLATFPYSATCWTKGRQVGTQVARFLSKIFWTWQLFCARVWGRPKWKVSLQLFQTWQLCGQQLPDLATFVIQKMPGRSPKRLPVYLATFLELATFFANSCLARKTCHETLTFLGGPIPGKFGAPKVSRSETPNVARCADNFSGLGNLLHQKLLGAEQMLNSKSVS